MASVLIRPATEADMAFIFDAWSESYRESHSAGPVPMPMYRRHSREWIAWYLDRPGVRIHLASNAEDTRYEYVDEETGETWQGGAAIGEQIYGFLVSESAVDHRTGKSEPCIHYCFVKQPFRRFGLAKALLTEAGINPKLPFIFSHKTAQATKLLRKGRLPGRFSLYGRFPKKATQSKEIHEAQASDVQGRVVPDGQPDPAFHEPGGP